jgi:hypothetical protein
VKYEKSSKNNTQSLNKPFNLPKLTLWNHLMRQLALQTWRWILPLRNKSMGRGILAPFFGIWPRDVRFNYRTLYP